MDKTQNYSLQKPLSVEKYSISIHNMNMDLIDSALKRIEQKNESQDNLLATKESLNTEITRATTKESSIESSLNNEVSRAQSAESDISNNLENEVSRATTAELNINSELSGHKSNESNPHNVTKSQVGLGNVDNTSDIDKPVSTAQQNALDLKAPLESPILTGTPKAPTASDDTNTTQIATTAFSQTVVSNHNTSESSHSDIRTLISGLTTRLNTLADSDDTTLDQLSEIVAYIKNNKDLIDCITTSKVNVSDIIDSLTDNSTDKPLSSRQGTVLKGLITDLTAIVGDKVDKVSGKELSTNDFTNEYKNKLDSVSSGANVNVQSDWNITDATSDAFIKNKPTSMPASDVPDWAKADTKPTYTKSEIGLENVENKSSATIRSELTKENVTNALGYTPYSSSEVDDKFTELHTHSNKSVLDSIDEDSVNSWDNIKEYVTTSNFPVNGESNKLYIASDTNITYRWNGTTYKPVGSDLALGETENNAYRGDRGKIAYDHTNVKSGNPHNVTASDIGLEKVENKSSEEIRNDLTYDNIVEALGYAPQGQAGIGEMRFEIDENYDLILIAPDGYNPPLELGTDGNLYYCFS